jgi:hypothetical protein
MRLLKVDGNGPFCFAEEFSDHVPPYAVLSHTWGRDEDEVTFQDIRTGSGRAKAGYEKLRFCSQWAKRVGLAYFWVDTCCIKKEDSSELQEAITSMFSWYARAARCYVYLADVTMYDEPGEDFSIEPVWITAFCDSRWFRRGWTLQELLAPKIVIFFSKQGKPLRDRNQLAEVIHSITSIPVSALRSVRGKRKPLSQFTVEERMQWAQGRDTKRVEDKAYCLLGVFGVRMYLNYGEGEHAMIRLKEGIHKSSKRMYFISAQVVFYFLRGFSQWTVVTDEWICASSQVRHSFSSDRDCIVSRLHHRVCHWQVGRHQP